MSPRSQWMSSHVWSSIRPPTYPPLSLIRRIVLTGTRPTSFQHGFKEVNPRFTVSGFPLGDPIGVRLRDESLGPLLLRRVSGRTSVRTTGVAVHRLSARRSPSAGLLCERLFECPRLFSRPRHCLGALREPTAHSEFPFLKICTSNPKEPRSCNVADHRCPPLLKVLSSTTTCGLGGGSCAGCERS